MMEWEQDFDGKKSVIVWNGDGFSDMHPIATLVEKTDSWIITTEEGIFTLTKDEGDPLNYLRSLLSYGSPAKINNNNPLLYFQMVFHRLEVWEAPKKDG